MLSKFGKRLTYLGEKVTGAVSWLGQKGGNFLLNATPVISAINPALGSVAMRAGGVLSGVGAIARLANNAINRRSVSVSDVNQVRSAASKIKDDGLAIRDAYQSLRGRPSQIEKN